MRHPNNISFTFPLFTLGLALAACASGEPMPTRQDEGGSSSTGDEVAGTSEAAPESEESDAQCAPLAPQVEDVMRTFCAGCHDAESKAGGMDYVTDLSALIARGKVIPGDPDNSPLFARMDALEMPPAGTEPRPGPVEIDLVQRWIAAGACVTAGPTNCIDNRIVSRDEMVDSMRDDIQDLDPEDRPFIRYLTLTHLHNAGACDSELEPHRHAVSKLLNSLSHEPLIAVPPAIDPERTIFRVDLRDYGWDDTSTLLGGDIWEATAAANPYALTFTGGAAEDLREDTGSDRPFQPADSFLRVATRAPLYHAILRIPGDVLSLEAQLGLDVARNVTDEEVLRAGFRESGVSEFNRVIERHAIPAASNRYYYRSFDFNSSSGDADIFAHPLDFKAAGGEYIFSLPNGMQAYVISDAMGLLLDEAPIQIVKDPKQRDNTVRTAISCMSCHDRGILPKNDEIGPFVDANKTKFPDAQLRETVEAIYRPEFIDQQKQDASLFAAALASAGVPVDAPEPIVRMDLAFDADLDLARVAAELGIDPELLKKNLSLLDVSLQGLYDGGLVSRETFDGLFEEVMCALLIGDEVTPLCDGPT